MAGRSHLLFEMLPALVWATSLPGSSSFYTGSCFLLHFLLLPKCWCVPWLCPWTSFLKYFLLEYSCFTVLCEFLLSRRVNQLNVYICPLFFGFPPHLGKHRARSRACATPLLLLSCLFYTQYPQYVYVNSSLPVHPIPLSVDLFSVSSHSVTPPQSCLVK